MMASRLLCISFIFFILLFANTNALRQRFVRQAAVCANPTGNMCGFVACENGGICYEDPTTVDCYRCQCTAGYTGKVCDTSIVILPAGCNPGCQNGGVCNFNVCECLAGYSGTFCEIRDYCLPNNPCQNGGQCISTGTSYLCDCNGTGYNGITCTNLIPTDPCLSSPCQNGGQCAWDGSNLDCICINGYSGTYCQFASIPCVTTPCQNGGICEQLGTNTYGCTCPPDYTGAQCETSVLATNPCVTAPLTTCQNGGTCTTYGANYLCQCAAGWGGMNCEIQGSTNSCNPSPCGTYGSCVEAIVPGGTIAVCNCQSPWTGKYCDVNMAVTCTGYCLFGGTCQMVGNVPYCTCPPLYTGQRCELYMGGVTTTTTSVPVVTLCAVNPCVNGGTCYTNNNISVCACPPTWTGPTCAVLETITTTLSPGVSACSSSPCINGGTCFPNGNSFVCACLAAWTGPICATPATITTTLSPGVSACSSSPCINGGTCFVNGNSFVCACLPAWTGVTCQYTQVVTVTPPLTTPSAGDACISQPCRNGGKCFNYNNSYYCQCISIYTGVNCETATPFNCPLNCAPGECLPSGSTITPYVCMCDGTMKLTSCTSK